MDTRSFALINSIIGKEYVKTAQDIRKQRTSMFNTLLTSKRAPEIGWDVSSIRLFLEELSSLDSNSSPSNVGVGDREGRVYSTILSSKCNFAHGMGRSGHVTAVQPKAPGSSVIVQLVNRMVKDLLKIQGLESDDVIVLPVATGMALATAIRALKREGDTCLWLRVDQKTCFKAVLATGLRAHVVEGKLVEDQVITDLEALEEGLRCKGVACVVSTVSCFAPRAPDNVEGIARLCQVYDVPHIINSAFGFQDKSTCKAIRRAATVGRVDCVVGSTDKNLMVPVGGSIVCGLAADVTKSVSQAYPGRASITPVVDVLVTLLEMGTSGWEKLVIHRVEMFVYFKQELRKCCEGIGEKVLDTPDNPISIAMTLCGLGDSATMLGSMLFTHCVSGARTVNPVKSRQIEGVVFQGYGSHCNDYPFPYLICSSAIGITQVDIDRFIVRLKKSYIKLSAKTGVAN